MVFQRYNGALRFGLVQQELLVLWSKSSFKRLALSSSLPIPFKQASKAIKLCAKPTPCYEEQLSQLSHAANEKQEVFHQDDPIPHLRYLSYLQNFRSQ